MPFKEWIDPTLQYKRAMNVYVNNPQNLALGFIQGFYTGFLYWVFYTGVFIQGFYTYTGVFIQGFFIQGFLYRFFYTGFFIQVFYTGFFIQVFFILGFLYRVFIQGFLYRVF